METPENNKLSIIIYTIIVLVIAIGGYLLITQKNKEENKSTNSPYTAIKKETEKDYIYYSDQEVASSHLNIIYQNIHINIDSTDASNTAEAINKRSAELSKTIKHISEEEIDEDNPPLFDEDDIYSATFYDYDYYPVKDKLILLVDEISYNCYGTGGPHKLSPYIFNLNNGSLISTENLLKEKNITKEEVEDKLTKYVDELKANLDPEMAIVDAEATKNAIKNGDYAIYLTKKGELVANIIVITTEQDYNEDIIIK